MSWFTIEKIDDITYAISEYGHYEQMHSYLLLGEKAALLIDTGLGISNIKEVVNTITDLPVKVISTHIHWDHIGGHHLFDDISVHEGDKDWLINGLPIPLEMLKKNLMKEPFKAPQAFNIDDYRVYRGQPTHILKDQEIIDIGSRKVKVIHTPGHSSGHICLWEEDKGYLYTGDLIYQGTLYAFYPSTSPEEYKKSIDKVSQLKTVRNILPAHHRLDIKVAIIDKMKSAFESIEEKGLLKHGSGIFHFGDFNIQL